MEIFDKKGFISVFCGAVNADWGKKDPKIF